MGDNRPTSSRIRGNLCQRPSYYHPLYAGGLWVNQIRQRSQRTPILTGDSFPLPPSFLFHFALCELMETKKTLRSRKGVSKTEMLGIVAAIIIIAYVLSQSNKAVTNVSPQAGVPGTTFSVSISGLPPNLQGTFEVYYGSFPIGNNPPVCVFCNQATVSSTGTLTESIASASNWQVGTYAMGFVSNSQTILVGTFNVL